MQHTLMDKNSINCPYLLGFGGTGVSTFLKEYSVSNFDPKTNSFIHQHSLKNSELPVVTRKNENKIPDDRKMTNNASKL